MKLAWPWQSGVLDPHGPIGAAERTILLDSTAIMLAVIVPVIILTLVFAWWFRSGNPKATRLPDWSYSGTHRGHRLVDSDADRRLSRRDRLVGVP